MRLLAPTNSLLDAKLADLTDFRKLGLAQKGTLVCASIRLKLQLHYVSFNTTSDRKAGSYIFRTQTIDVCQWCKQDQILKPRPK